MTYAKRLFKKYVTKLKLTCPMCVKYDDYIFLNISENLIDS